MSTGHYHRRWSAGTSVGRTTPTSSTLSSNVEPSTYGTSWNSVRWNKPATSGYRSHSSSIAARFDQKPSYSVSPAARGSTSRYTPSSTIGLGLSSAARTAASIASMGPSVSSRASRFDSSVRDQQSKYRSEARDLINKWTSRERGGGPASDSSSRRATDTASTSSYLNKATDYPYRTTSMTPSRASAPTASRYSSLDRNSIMSPSPTPSTQLSFSTSYLPTLKMERPWRQRMAESSRIRATHGDDYGSRQSSRESSVYAPASRFSSYTSSYQKAEDKTPKYMSRSYSPIRSPDNIFRTSRITGVDHGVTRTSSQESVSQRDDSRHAPVSAVPKNPSIRESSRERDAEKKKRSSKDRTARRNSRQRSQNLESSSSDDEGLTKEEAKRRRRRRRNGGETPPLPPQSANMAKSMQSSMYETGQEDSKAESQSAAVAQAISAAASNLVLNLTESESFQSCAPSPCSPRMGQKISRNNSKTRLPSKSQLIKSPSIVEVPGISKSDSKSNVSMVDKNVMSNSLEHIEDIVYDESGDENSQEDESQYSAVAHFKPFKPKVKRLAPVPGVWNQATGEENISKNKAFLREESHATTFIVWKVRPLEAASKKIKEQKPKIVAKPVEEVKHVFAKPTEMVKKPVPPAAKPIEEVKKQAPADKKGVVVEPKKQQPEAVQKKPEAVKKVVEKKEAVTVKPVAEPTKESKDQKIDEKSAVKKLFLNNKKSKAVLEEAPVEKKVVKPVEEAAAQIAIALKAKEPSATGAITWKDKRRLSITHSKKIRAIPEEAATSTDSVFKRKPSSLRAVKTLRPKGKVQLSASLSCLATVQTEIAMQQTMARPETYGGAQVIVDTPQKGVNVARAKLRARERRSMPSLTELKKREEQIQLEQQRIHLEAREPPPRSLSRESQSKAAEVLDEMRGKDPALEWTREDHDVLILPDKSILEEYVKRKRGRLERLHSEPLRDRDDLSGCDSPCHSTTSELLPASAARYHDISARVPLITAPSRSSSSVDTSTPTAMLESYHSSYNNFNSTPQAFLRTSTARQQCARPIAFEAPKTPFEQRLQMQATAIRNAGTGTQENEAAPSRRVSLPSESMPTISSSFTSAMAERQGQNRHERYAAHIPMNRGDGSGRQSAASVESSQSGALDVASKQLDHVIDQARHRHHLHRNKFKDAIDYLDQIFEDLKKECDTSEDKNNNGLAEENGTASRDRDSRPSTNTQQQSQQPKTNSLPNRAQRHHKPVQPPSPAAEITVITAPSSSTPPDVAVTETIILPKKTDKLDFTRRWLQDDLSSLARQPMGPVAMMPEQSQYTDVDEHSLGSCSAEVAAINSSTRKEKKRSTVPCKPMIAAPPAQLAPIRPQPCRPQPVYGTPGSSNGTRHFPMELEAPSLQRVASFDHVSDRQRDSGIWRSGSQEPYQTLGSARSDADSRPSPSAFHNVTAFPQRGGIRGSMSLCISLPDGNVVRGRSRPSPPRDPSMNIDLLVAELELNTEQPMSNSDKRRSFPTSFRTEDVPMQRAERRAPARGRGNSNGYPSQAAYHAPVSHVASHPVQLSAQRSAPRQQKSLDEVAMMLNNVVSEFGANQRKKSQGSSTMYSTPQGAPQSKPFDTINQEKINPSRVEAMHNMFERGNGSHSSNNHQQSWRNQPPQPYKPLREEESYYDIAEFAVKPSYKRVSPPRQQIASSSSYRRSSPHGESIPVYPLTQPPQHPPGPRNGSANSSTNGGYYSSNSSTAGPTHNQPVIRRSSLVGRQSISSRAPSVEDEDDGFYDNIGVFDDRRFSRGSELDVASISSRQLPPKQNKIGSFLRKIGGSRPPGSAASLVSLNKVAVEAPIKSGMLMKSNSLSNEPWKQQVLQQSMPREATASKGSLGSRLRNSLFGSKKRLNG